MVMKMDKPFEDKLKLMSRDIFGKSMEKLNKDEIYELIGKFVNEKCENHMSNNQEGKTVAYFSIEYLLGRLLESNLYNMRCLPLMEKALNDTGHSLSELSDIEDYAFGNGGLGRLAACFLDSAASNDIPLDGYSIRYKYGLFKQCFNQDGSQQEYPDDWSKHGDPFGIKKEDEKVQVNFSDYSVIAMPYDYYIIGYNFKRINRLRLYECLPLNCDKRDAERIYEYLYPDDSTYEGKKLRLRQQYFAVSAAMQNIAGKYGLEEIENKIKIQLNDTHLILAIAELINICIKSNMSFDDGLNKCQKIFAYTNHTVMPEALEQWDCELLRQVIPEIYGIIRKLNDMALFQFSNHKSIDFSKCAIIFDGKIRMANLACFVCSHINGVASLHTEILKDNVLSQWYSIYPEKFSNKTNGISQRRWLGLANENLADFLSKLCDCDIIEETNKISHLLNFKDDEQVINELFEIKKKNKEALAKYIAENCKVKIDSDSVYLVQIKRIHEYKRQLLGIFLAIHFYLSIKKGESAPKEKMTFIFAGKAASSYKIAKSIIRFINCAAKVINSDEEINDRVKVVFCENYNVSLAQKIIPAADISMQLSLAGTEASGTGNMKLMMNGAVTLGTYDGANIEIVEKATMENNYIFGMRASQVESLKNSYSPKKLYDESDKIKSLVDTLIDGTFSHKDDFRDIYDSLLFGEQADRFMVLGDLEDFIKVSEKAIRDYEDKPSFGKKSLINIGSSAYFSSDRTIKEYAEEIWFK